MSIQSIETGQAGRHGERSYVKTDNLTITAKHDYLGSVTEERLYEVVSELVEATEFVQHRDQQEAVVNTTFDTAEVEEVTVSNGDRAVASRNGDAIGVTIHCDTHEAEQEVERLVDRLVVYHNERLRGLMVND